MLADFFARFAAALLSSPQVFVAVVEALEGGTVEADLVASIRAAQVKATEAAAEADLGPHP